MSSGNEDKWKIGGMRLWEMLQPHRARYSVIKAAFVGGICDVDGYWPEARIAAHAPPPHHRLNFRFSVVVP